MENQNLPAQNIPESSQNSTENSTFIQDMLRFKLAVFIMIIYIGSLIYLMGKVDGAADLSWSRYLFLFSGLEAIVFAALGYVFGKDVTRRAEQTADKKAAEAEAAKKKAEALKEQAENKLKNTNENLIRLQEAILSENKMTISGIHSFEDKFNIDKGEKKLEKRSLNLVQDQLRLLNNPIVSFDYKIELETESDFESVYIDGETRESLTGTFNFVQTYGNAIDVTVKTKNDSIWKFTAKNIYDENRYINMIMVNPPLQSNDSTGTFYVK